MGKSINTYCIYDTKDNDLMVCIGNSEDVEKFLNQKIQAIWVYYKKGSLCHKRYKVEILNKKGGQNG